MVAVLIKIRVAFWRDSCQVSVLLEYCCRPVRLQMSQLYSHWWNNCQSGPASLELNWDLGECSSIRLNVALPKIQPSQSALWPLQSGKDCHQTYLSNKKNWITNMKIAEHNIVNEAISNNVMPSSSIIQSSRWIFFRLDSLFIAVKPPLSILTEQRTRFLKSEEATAHSLLHQRLSK